MLLRRVIEHVNAQNWFAVGLDFLIVVVGVFIGIQVSNWNDARLERMREVDLLKNMRDDIQNDIVDMNKRLQDFAQVKRFGGSALTALAPGTSCSTGCWQFIIHAFHASQWFAVNVQSDFDELRRAGWPSNETLKDELATYFLLQARIEQINEISRYRELVRSHIPSAAQKHMWSNCYRSEGRHEYLREDCPPILSNAESARVIAALQSQPDIVPALTYSLSNINITEIALERQIEIADKLIASINAEIGEK